MKIDAEESHKESRKRERERQVTDEGGVELLGEDGVGQAAQVGLEQRGGDVHVGPARVPGGRGLPAVQRRRQRRHARRVAGHAVHAHRAQPVRLRHRARYLRATLC